MIIKKTILNQLKTKYLLLFTIMLCLLGCASSPASKNNQVSSSSATIRSSQLFKIGDIGPAGGIVFYDKGNGIGGWRFLEAAPAETEEELFFGGMFVGKTGRRVGDGKENTEIYMQYIQRRGGGVNTAVWYCDGLVINGYDDWYLPSSDELLYIYHNLYLNELGDFLTAKYWCSTYLTLGGNRYIDFNIGEEVTTTFTSYKYKVRAVRRF